MRKYLIGNFCKNIFKENIFNKNTSNKSIVHHTLKVHLIVILKSIFLFFFVFQNFYISIIKNAKNTF